MRNQKILVTGGAGFIGSHLVDSLLEAGYAVRILDNLAKPTHQGIPTYLSKEAEFLHGDVSVLEDVEKALEGVSGVFHLAAAGGFTSDIALYAWSNSYGTALLMETIARGRTSVERVVVASSVGVYGEGSYVCEEHGKVYPSLRKPEDLSAGFWEQKCPRCAQSVGWGRTAETKSVSPEKCYSISKYDQERTVLSVGREIGIHCTALRYFLTYGPRQSLRNPYTGICSIFVSQLANGVSPRVFEDGQQMRDFIYVDDVVRANMLVYQDPRANGEVFNAGTGHPAKITELANSLGTLLGKSVQAQSLGEYRLGEVRHIVADNSKLESLGFKTATSLKQGLTKYVEWVQGQGDITDCFSKAYGDLLSRGVVRRAQTEPYPR
jgi:dTDP-L-rhamnose 4-epimerase